MKPATHTNEPRDWEARETHDFLVTWEARGRARSTVWKSERPLALGYPPRWFLRRSKEGISAVGVERSSQGYRALRTIVIPPHAIENANRVPLALVDSFAPSPVDWAVTLRPLRRPPAPYEPAPSSEPIGRAHQWMLYCGLGPHLLAQRRVGTKFKIHIEDERIFSYKHAFPGHIVSPEVAGLWLVQTDGKKRELAFGKLHTLSEEEWRNGRLVWNRYWWRITPLPIADEFTPELRRRPSSGDAARLSRFIQWGAILSACFISALLVLPRKPKAPPLPPPRETVSLKVPKFIPDESPPELTAPAPSAPRKMPASLTPQRGTGPSDGFTPPSESRDRASERARRRREAEAQTESEVEEPPTESTESLEANASAETTRPPSAPPAKSEPLVPAPRNHTIVPRGSRGRQLPPMASIKITGVGRVERTEIERTLERHLGVFQDCYRQLLADKPEARGVLEMEWVIGSDGATTDVGVAESDLRDKTLASCVTEEIRRTTFPRPRGGPVRIRFPVVFSSGY